MTAFWIAVGVLVVSIVVGSIVGRWLGREAERRRWVEDAHEPGQRDHRAG